MPDQQTSDLAASANGAITKLRWLNWLVVASVVTPCCIPLHYSFLFNWLFLIAAGGKVRLDHPEEGDARLLAVFRPFLLGNFVAACVLLLIPAALALYFLRRQLPRGIYFSKLVFAGLVILASGNLATEVYSQSIGLANALGYYVAWPALIAELALLVGYGLTLRAVIRSCAGN